MGHYKLEGCYLPFQAQRFHHPIFLTLQNEQTLPSDLHDQCPLFHSVVSQVQWLPAVGHYPM
jgi:hypothetical protein